MKGTLAWLTCIILMSSLNAAAQYQGMSITVYPDGWCKIEEMLNVSDVIMEIPLIGEPSYVTVLDEDGLPLNYTVENLTLIVDAGASTLLNITYDTQSLTFKQGLVWSLNLTENFSSPIEVRFIGAPDIVGISNTPLSIKEGPDYLELVMSAPFYIEYVYTSPSVEGKQKEGLPYLYILSLIIALVVASLWWLNTKRRAKSPIYLDSVDLSILSSLSGGEKSLSGLRRELSIPKTTLWRRARRLEENGLLEVRKTPTGNVLRITKKGRNAVKEEERKKDENSI